MQLIYVNPVNSNILAGISNSSMLKYFLFISIHSLLYNKKGREESRSLT